ncbi:MAG: efflux RND transporter periplasmic adaptor subunit, partial [Alphaproteobacteria bacterium]|nr:efflux RND transporter periplasmic adaptor subunit [Alphaproteobacteria bacterium]
QDLAIRGDDPPPDFPAPPAMPRQARPLRGRTLDFGVGGGRGDAGFRAGPPSDSPAAETARAARSQYDQARAGARPEDVRAASAQVAQARGAAAEVEAARAETSLIAPAAGEVGRRLAQPGEIVGAGFPVLLLTEVQAPWVTVTLREDQMQGVRMGSAFNGRIPALDGRQARFQVSFIAPAGDYATWRATRQSSGFDIKGFELRLKPVQPIRGLRPGMSVLFDWPQ